MKYRYLSIFLILLILSIGAVCAQEDVASEDNIAIAQDSEVLSSNEFVIDDGNYDNYFDNNGIILENSNISDGDTIKLGNVSNKDFIIDKLLTVTSNSSGDVLTNVSFYFMEGSDNSTISGLNFVNYDAEEHAITVMEVTNVEISNNVIDVQSIDTMDDRLYAICAYLADNLKIESNVITYVGKTDGTAKNYALYVSGSNNVEVNDNSFNIDIPAGGIDWSTGFGSAEGIVFDTCDDLVFSENTVEVVSNNVVGSYPTVYAVHIGASDNTIVTNNEIFLSGNITYLYGFKVDGKDFLVSENIIDVYNDNYGAWGIEIAPSASGVIDSNSIYVSANNVSYGVYASFDWYTYDCPNVNYTSNYIEVNAFATYAMELFGSDISVIDGNIILAEGNYTLGISSMVMYDGSFVITNNDITVNGLNDGEFSTGDMVPAITVGILNMAECQIQNNAISSAGNWSIINTGYDGEITDNYLVSSELLGDDSVDDRMGITVENNIPIKDAVNYNLTNDTFFLFFNRDGWLRENITAESLTFIGEFSDLTLWNVIDRPIKLFGDNATLYDMSFFINSDNVVVENFTFISDSLSEIITVAFSDNISILSSDFIVNGVADDNNAVIHLIGSQYSIIDRNTIDFAVETNDTHQNMAILAEGSYDLVVSNNNIRASIPSRSINWTSGKVYSAGVYLYKCDDSVLEGNYIYVDSNGQISTYDTIYAVDIIGDNVNVSENSINVYNSPYGYALVISGEDFMITENSIFAGGVDYSCGIDVEGAASGIVDSNNIYPYSSNVAYGIYACDWNMEGQAVNYTYNEIYGDAYAVYGMELLFGEKALIDCNNIILYGNYTTGIAEMMIDDAAIITNNEIFVYGTNADMEDTGDMVPATTVGIFSMGESLIYGNAITSAGNWTVHNTAADSEITGNYLVSKDLLGDDSVNDTSGETIVEDNIPLSNATNYNLTNDTFFLFFDDMGCLRENITAESLTFIGEFSDLTKWNIIINRPVKLLSDNATLYDMSFTIVSDNVTVDGLSFVSDELSGIITVFQNNVSIVNCDFTLFGAEDAFNWVISVLESDDVLIDGNSIIFDVETNGTYHNHPIYAKNSDALTISNNNITASLPARSINWTSGEVYSVAVYLDDCDDAVFEDNTITAESNGQISTYDTLYAVDIKGDNAVVSKNEINVYEAPYPYGLVISGENFMITKNFIFAGVVGDYACGIDIEGAASGIVKSNKIRVFSPKVAYGIYACDWNMEGQAVNYTYNDIYGDAYAVYGMELLFGEKALIDCNNIILYGNYTTGIAEMMIDDAAIITNNDIYAYGAKTDMADTGDMVPATTVGIFSMGDSLISGNAITSAGNWTVHNTAADSEITRNYLVSKDLLGDDSVNDTSGETIVEDNIPLSNATNYNLTNDTFFLFFDDMGCLRENITAESLTFIGEFSDLIDVIYIERPIALLGDDAGLYDLGISIHSDNVTVEDFTFFSESLSEIIGIHESNNVSIISSNFIVQGLADDANTVIHVFNSDNVLIYINTINFTVETNDTYKNTAILAEGSDDLVIDTNDIIANLPARSIDWATGTVYSEGVCLDDCNNAILDDNTIAVKSNGQIEQFDTIYAAHITGDNVTLIYNRIGAIEAPYGYALVIAGEDFFIGDNYFAAGENGTYACGIDVESNSNGVIDTNLIYAIGNVDAYGIYTANWGGDVKTNITNNSIYANANSPFALSLSGSEALVEKNAILVEGNYTTGIASAVDNITINNNTIIANGSNVGTPLGHDLMGIETTGVHIADGNAKVTNNNVTTTGEFAVDLEGTGQVTENYLVADVYTGDASVKYTPDQRTMVQNNTPAMQRAVLSANDIVMYYKNGTRYVVVLTDQEGNPLSNKVVTLTINGASYNRTTDDNGTVSLAINLNAGNYTASAAFVGETGYSNVTIENNITVLTTITGNDVVKMYKNGTQYYATFVDGQGNPLNGTNVQFNINGVFYIRTTNENGTAQLNINLNPDTYIITAINLENGERHSNNITVLSNIVSSDLVKYYRNGSQYVVTVYGEDGKVVGAGENVTFNINGVFYTRTTNASGQAQLNINIQPGNYTITAQYKECMVSNNIEVKPILSASDLVKKYGVSDQFIAYLVDGQGNPYEGQTVQFNIHGVYYNRTTDADGRAILNIRLGAASDVYIITSMYNDCWITNKITIVP